MENVFFSDWESVAKVAIMTPLAYLLMVILLRISGKRTLSKMNSFDFIITVVMGSSLAAVSLNKNIALAEGVVCFAILIFMQYAVTWLSVRFKFVKRIITNQPILLAYKGELYNDILIKERITIEDINLNMREQGLESIEEVDAIVLETTGKINIFKDLSSRDVATLKSVEMPKV